MSFEFLIEMAWKSALIAGVALALVTVLRSRAAADRAAVLRVAVTLLLLLPLFSLVLPKLEVEAWSAEAIPALPTLGSMEASQSPGIAPLSGAPLEPTIWDDPSLLFLLLYLGGAAMAAARLGAGLWTLRRWTKSARDVDCPRWNEAFERACWATRAPPLLRLMVSDEAPSPLSWGLFRPVILIDPDTLGEPEDADAILAHEIAHVVRRDWAVLMLTRAAAALFWFNPLVWVLEREVVQQAEEAADIEAALWVEPARYAQTLVHWAQFSAAAAIPANSIAPSAAALSRRVRAILDARLRSTPSGSAWTLAAIAGCAAFAVTLAVLQLIPEAAAARPVPAAAPIARAVPAPPAPITAPTAEAATLVVNGALTPVVAPTAVAAVAVHPHPEVPPTPMAPPLPPTPPRVRVDVRAPTARADVRVDVDTLVQMRIHGIDGEYIRALAAANGRYARLRAEELVAMRIHGVSPAYVREMASAGYRDLSPEAIVAMRIHGVSANAARRAARVRGRILSPEELLERAIDGED